MKRSTSNFSKFVWGFQKLKCSTFSFFSGAEEVRSSRGGGGAWRWCSRLHSVWLCARSESESIWTPVLRLGAVSVNGWKDTRLFLATSWPSRCQKSWQPGGSRRRVLRPASAGPGRRWRWTSTAPTPHRPSPSTTSTRAASSRHTSTCENSHWMFIYLCKKNWFRLMHCGWPKKVFNPIFLKNGISELDCSPEQVALETERQ